jgi:hypothetical protein
MKPFFIQGWCGRYTYEKKDHWGKEVLGEGTGHSVYGLDEDGQIWKYTCQKGNWDWAKLEDTKPTENI